MHTDSDDVTLGDKHKRRIEIPNIFKSSKESGKVTNKERQ